MKKFNYFLIICLLSFPATTRAQSGIASASGSALSLAGSNGASLTGWEAALINPAALNFTSNSSQLEFTIFSFGGLFGNNNLSRKLYDAYFTGDGKGNGYNLENDLAGKNEVKSAFDPNLTGYAKSQLVPFGISYKTQKFGSFGFMIISGGSGNFLIPKGFSERLFDGLTKPETTSELDGLLINGMFRNEFVFSYANSLPIFRNYLSDFNIGGSLKFENGLSYGKFEIIEGHLSTSETGVITHQIDYRAKTAGNDYFYTQIDPQNGISDPGSILSPAGFGLGFDVGISGTTKSKTKFYLSIIDIGWINWYRNAASITLKDNITLTHYDAETNSESDNAFVDSLRNHYQPVRKEGGFITSLPTTINAGISVPFESLPIFEHLHYPGKIIGHFAIHEGLNKESGNSFIPRAATAIEWMFFDMLSVRSGISFGGVESFNLAFGLGLSSKFFKIDLGTANFYQLMLGHSATKYSFSANLSWFIPGI